MAENPKYAVAVIGGAVAGAEAGKVLAERGISVVVFEQGARPYGKIEDGLPVWHSKMRKAEFARIDLAYQHPLVSFVPKTRIGDDLAFESLSQEWGFNFVLLANGAWRDRPLGIDGVDSFINKGFYYQNPLMYWFNRRGNGKSEGTPCELKAGALVVGGGLASIDVCKVFMLSTIHAALAKRGIETDIETLERRGCDKILEENKLTFSDLGVEACTLFYRRQEQDMPLVAFKEGASDEDKLKTYKTRQVLLNRAMKRYFFKVSACNRPIDKLVEDGRLVGLRFIKTKVENGQLVDVPGSEFDVKAPVTVSSIGSIPEPIPGIATKGELYTWQDFSQSQLNAETYGLGNVVTGKGNIAVSRKHSKSVTAVDAPLDKQMAACKELTAAGYANLQAKIKGRQQEVGYNGDYPAWLKANPPVDLLD